jgi:hypothetical protein
MVEQYAAHYFARKNELVISSLNVISINARSGGLNIYMEIFGKRFEMLPAHRKLFESEWEAKLLKNIIFTLHVQGFIVIEFVPSDVMPGELVPRVMPPEQGIVTIIDIPGRKRMFRVYHVPQSLTPGTGGRGFGKRAVGLGQLGEPRNDVLVFEYDEINPNGSLNSPVISCMNKLSVWDNLFENLDVADWYRSRPVWVVRRANQSNAPDPMEQDHYAEEDLGIYMRKFGLIREKQHRKNFADAVVSATKSQAGMHRRIGEITDAAGMQASSSSKTFGQRRAPPEPYLHHFELPEGQDMAQPPQAEVLPTFAAAEDKISAIVFQVFGIPPQLMFSSHVVHETSAKMTLRLFNERIRDMQKFIEPILQRLYLVIYENSHESFNAEVAKDIFSKYMRGAGEGKKAAKGKKASKKNSTTADGEPRLNKKGLSDNADGVIPLGEPVTRMKAASLKQPQVLEMIQKNINVYISFKRTPLTEYVDLKALYDENIISRATFSKHAVSIVGLNEDEIMSDSEREQQEKEKLETEKKYAEVANAGKPEPGTAKKTKRSASPSAKKKKAKPSGSTAPSGVKKTK